MITEREYMHHGHNEHQSCSTCPNCRWELESTFIQEVQQKSEFNWGLFIIAIILTIFIIGFVLLLFCWQTKAYTTSRQIWYCSKCGYQSTEDPHTRFRRKEQERLRNLEYLARQEEKKRRREQFKCDVNEIWNDIISGSRKTFKQLSKTWNESTKIEWWILAVSVWIVAAILIVLANF